MLDLQALRQDINGKPDLYRGLRKQLPFPVPMNPESNQIFFQVANTIARLFPKRINTPIQNSYDARIVIIEFCGDPRTSRNDILRVIDQL